MVKSPEAFRTISEVGAELDVPQHVLRFWETRFSQIKPLKRGGGRRYYRPEDLALLKGIRALLYTDGMTIKGVQKVIREQGVRAVIERARSGVSLPSVAARSAPAVAGEIVALAAATDGAGLPHDALNAVLDGLLEVKALLAERRAGRTAQAPVLRQHA